MSRSCSTSTASTCACPARSGSTSPHAARPSSTSSSTTSRSATASSTPCASGRACCTASPTASPAPRCTRSGCPGARRPWVETVRLHFPRYGLHADELCVTRLADVAWAVQMSTVEFHPWNSRRADTEKPDEWRIDLDPMPDAPFSRVRRAAHVAHEVLDELGAVGWPKTSGGHGLHVYVRIVARPRVRGRAAGRAGVRAGGGAPHPRRRDHDLVAQGPRPRGRVRRLQPERPRPHDRGGLLGARQRHRHGLDALPVGRARRRGAQRLHHRDGARALRRARRPARRHRRRGVRHRPAPGVGRARRGRGREAPPEPEDDTGKP